MSRPGLPVVFQWAILLPILWASVTLQPVTLTDFVNTSTSAGFHGFSATRISNGASCRAEFLRKRFDTQAAYWTQFFC